MVEFIQSIINGFAVGSAYALIGLGLTVVYSVYRVLNLSHGEFFMLGAYVSYFAITKFHIPFFISLIISIFVIGILGIITEKIIFRPLRNRNESDVLIVTVGMLFLLENFALLLWSANIKNISSPFENMSLHAFGLAISYQRLFILILTIILILTLHYFYNHSKLGKQMRATSQDKATAELMGINVKKVGMIAFFISAALAALAGTLMGDLQSISPTMGFYPLLMAIVVVVFGGLGSVLGAIVGGIILGIVQSLSVTYFSAALSNLIVYLILFIMLMWKPNGLFGRKLYG